MQNQNDFFIFSFTIPSLTFLRIIVQRKDGKIPANSNFG